MGNLNICNLNERDFTRLSKMIYSECGIKMPPTKKTLLEGRLQKRIRALGFKDFEEYCDFLFTPEGRSRELIQLIDVITTNKTDFFREPAHFDYLVQSTLPHLEEKYGIGSRRKLMLWSAGCSTGEEPYTLSMVLKEYALRHQRFNFEILATDISTRVLEKAQMAIYEEERADPVPHDLKKKYFLKSKDREKKLIRVVPELRDMIRFRRVNFIESDFGMREPMDIIFCRNVIIYFDKITQEKVLNRFCQHLIPGGYVFMGHSETLNGLNLPLIHLTSTIYKKPE